MLYREFKGKKLSLMGFGAMRLPLLADGSVDESQAIAMVDHAMANGINYFDTAWPYHSGASERIIGKALAKYDRNSYYLATKYPGHQISSKYDPADVFEKQLQKCGVEYFDFYLLHNVYEHSLDVYTDPQWGILEYFKEQKRLGRIKHLGFSTHGQVDFIRKFLDEYGEDMEFCQIQLNYLDWTLQDAKGKYELLTQRGIPVWVMEPVRGGRLANLTDAEVARLREVRPEETPVAWGLRFLRNLPNVGMILSGVSSLTQMEQNTRTFNEDKPLNEAEVNLLLDIAEGMKDSVPCTACRYCCDGCPMGLDIPMLMETYNDMRFSINTNTAMRIQGLPEDKKPTACIGCGACAQVCPQKIDIPEVIAKLNGLMEKAPSWVEICKQREAAQK
ncbi:MAG: 4Fe-4S dicluster domain-containing protein [Ruminococcaceae bacterium]|nr:4Fe-4S dicluster domain-containing protein [Oscillospiraceae bacterium]